MLDEAAALNETSYGITITYLIAILIVFLVLIAQFESATSALVVIVTVPFGVCAAIFALALTDTSINIYSQIGVLMLIGIMAKNAILMVEFADQLRERGSSVVEAAREASITRFRPIVMTMVSTVLAGLPLILGTGLGQEARAAIGWVVFGCLAHDQGACRDSQFRRSSPTWHVIRGRPALAGRDISRGAGARSAVAQRRKLRLARAQRKGGARYRPLREAPE